MNITSIHVHREGLSLTRPYTIAYKTVSQVEIAWVEVHGERGLIGLGAANPSRQVVGEGVEEVIAALDEETLARFIGRDIRELRGLCEELHQLFPRQPGAKACLDIAFHDLFAQSLGIPLVQYLGQQIESLPTSITIGIKDVAGTLEEAEEYLGRGFTHLKIKLGHSVEEDIARLRALRERFGSQIGIRVDANQGYSVADLLHFHQQTQAHQLELIEQPLAANEIEALRQLPPELKLLIAADESLVKVEDAFHLAADPRACGIFNIKLMKCGGVHQALRIAEVARLSQCELMWGCNDESAISISAALHAAFACKHTKYIDLDGNFDLAREVVDGGFRLEEGRMYPLNKPGLGLQRMRL